MSYNGRPARFTFENYQVVGSNEQLADVGVEDSGAGEGGQVIPGSLLTRLNPLKDLDAEGRKEFARDYRELQEQLDNPADRLTVMDAQGIQCAVNYAALPGMEVEFEDDFDGLYANLVALNRYLGTEWGYNYEGRLFTPPFVSFADPDGALMLLDEIMKLDVPKVIQTSTGPSMHTSPFRPENDRFWSICSEAGIKLCTHLATVTRYGAQGLEWSEDEVMLGDMDAFQWAFYYGDRPAMETVGAAILQGWFRGSRRCSCSSPSRARCGCRTRSASSTTRSSWVGARRGGSSTGVRASTSRTTASSRPSPRRTSTGWSRRSASSRSCSAPTSRTGKGCPSPSSTSVS